jgi:hypothetical protein
VLEGAAGGFPGGSDGDPVPGLRGRLAVGQNEPMRRGLIAVLPVLLVLGAADAALADRFTGYGSCGAGSFDRDKTCVVGDQPVGVFIARKQDRVRYKFCVNKPDVGKRCDRKRTKSRGKPSQIGFSVHKIGKYRMKWRVPGEGQVAHFVMRVKRENA